MFFFACPPFKLNAFDATAPSIVNLGLQKKMLTVVDFMDSEVFQSIWRLIILLYMHYADFFVMFKFSFFGNFSLK